LSSSSNSVYKYNLIPFPLLLRGLTFISININSILTPLRGLFVSKNFIFIIIQSLNKSLTINLKHLWSHLYKLHHLISFKFKEVRNLVSSCSLKLIISFRIMHFTRMLISYYCPESFSHKLLRHHETFRNKSKMIILLDINESHQLEIWPFSIVNSYSVDYLIIDNLVINLSSMISHSTSGQSLFTSLILIFISISIITIPILTSNIKSPSISINNNFGSLIIILLVSSLLMKTTTIIILICSLISDMSASSIVIHRTIF